MGLDKTETKIDVATYQLLSPEIPQSPIPGWSTSCHPTEPSPIPRPGCGSHLPAEVWEIVGNQFRQEHARGQLAALAQTSRLLYNVIMPILYETIIVTDYSQSRLPFGLSPIIKWEGGGNGDVNGEGKGEGDNLGGGSEATAVPAWRPASDFSWYTALPMTRKDFAVIHCRRIIIDSAIQDPAFINSLGLNSKAASEATHQFRHVIEWIITARCLEASTQPPKGKPLLVARLPVAVSSHPGTTAKPKRVAFHLPQVAQSFRQLHWALQWAISPRNSLCQGVEYDFYNTSIDPERREDGSYEGDLRVHVYGALRSRVHFDSDRYHKRTTSLADWVSRTFTYHHSLFPGPQPAYEVIKLHSVPSIVIPSENLVTRQSISVWDIGADKALAEKLLNAVEFRTCDDPNAAMEYPWWRPVPYPVEGSSDSRDSPTAETGEE